MTEADESSGSGWKRLYGLLVEEDSGNGEGLPDEVLSEVPRNFLLYVASLVLTKLADAVSSPKTTLTWVMSAAGAPAFLIALLVPIRESGSMVPQIFTAEPIRRRALRKWIWVLGSLVQGLAIAAAGAAVFWTEGALAGGIILAALAVFSLARSLASVASKDVKGKVIPKHRRGQAGGLAASVSGVLVLAAGLALLSLRNQEVPGAFYGWMLIAAGSLWWLAAALFSRIRELPGETDGDSGGRALARLAVLKDDPVFRRFVLTRALFMSTALASPFYVLLARQRAGEGVSLLAAFLLASGLASSLSSIFWGRWADRSSRHVMIAGALLASVLGVAVFTGLRVAPSIGEGPAFYLGAFFLLGVAHSGVRLGRKTYVVDMAEGNQRTEYIAVSNTVIGLLLLASGALGALVGSIGPDGMLLLFAAMGFAGAALGAALPEVEGDGAQSPC